jgi:hypothetical protein
VGSIADTTSSSTRNVRMAYSHLLRQLT